MRVDPRAPSETDTFATVAMSGASTTFTKSNSPSVAHWCSTLHPSSSMSWFTWRRRSGFDLRVRTPCSVSVDRRMKIGMAGAYSRGLVDVQQRAADEQQWAEHEVGEAERDARTGRALRVQEGAQSRIGEDDDNDERGERSERVH